MYTGSKQIRVCNDPASLHANTTFPATNLAFLDASAFVLIMNPAPMDAVTVFVRLAPASSREYGKVFAIPAFPEC
jgi:hypothetical protein